MSTNVVGRVVLSSSVSLRRRGDSDDREPSREDDQE